MALRKGSGGIVAVVTIGLPLPSGLSAVPGPQGLRTPVEVDAQALPAVGSGAAPPFTHGTPRGRALCHATEALLRGSGSLAWGRSER